MSSHKKQREQYQKRRARQLKKKMRQSSFLPPETKIIQSPSGWRKMSDVLEDFVKPYMESIQTEDELRKLLALGIVAWNAALLPPSEREEMLHETEATLPAEVRDDLRTLLDPLIRRKQEHFADNRRAIINFDLTTGPTGPYLLNVMSTLEPLRSQKRTGENE